MSISKESINIFTSFPHGNKDKHLRLHEIKTELNDDRKPLYKEGLEVIKNINLKNKIIIDAGCGSGTKTIPLAVKSKAKKVIGIDGSKSAIKNAKFFSNELKIKNVTFLNEKLENLNQLIEKELKKNKVDLIVNYQNLHHVTDWKDLLKKFYDALKPGGLLVVNIVDPTSGFSQFMIRNKICYYLGKTPERRAKIGKFLFGILERKKNVHDIEDIDFYVDRFGAFYHWIFPNQIINEMNNIGFRVAETFPHFKLNDWLNANKNSKRSKSIKKIIKVFPAFKIFFAFLMRARQFVLGEDTRTYYAIKK